MSLSRTLSFALLFLMSVVAFGQPAIGQWRDHFPYRQTRAVTEGNGMVYCASRNAVFSLDPNTQELSRISKINGLSDVDISALSWNNALGALVIGYANGNIDAIIGERTVNISDIKRSSIIGDKKVYSMMNDGDRVYLGCGFGIVVLDLARQEVRDTWLIGPNAQQVEVHGITFHQDSIYAATDKGLFAAWRQEGNLAAFSSWHKRTDAPRSSGPFYGVASFAGKLFTRYESANNQQDSVFYWDDSWHFLPAAVNTDVRDLDVQPDGQRLVVSLSYQAKVFDPSLLETYAAGTVNGTQFYVADAIVRDNDHLWVATDNDGLAGCSPGAGTFYLPNGPRTNSVVRMQARDGWLMVATGNVAGNWTNAYLHQGVHILHDNTWRTVTDGDDPVMAGVNNYAGGTVDPMAVALDPAEPGHAYVGTWDEGVVEWRNGAATTIWNAGNSSLGLNGNTNDGIVDVAGLDMDADGNLWVSNANTTGLLSVKKTDNTWRAFAPGSVAGTNTLVSDVLAASNGLKWLVRPRSNGMLVFTDGGTIDDTGDDQWKAVTTTENQGKLPSMGVFCVNEDQDGQIWVGTDKGIAVFYNPDAIFLNDGTNWDSQQILIEQDGNVQILLETEVVSAIAIDGANRKWVGTQTSGVYLISADGTEQVEHFTAVNSPLPSNNVADITIDGSTGEVFFGTDQGIISYRGQATDGEFEASCALVFPNPVKETYTGAVAIKGLLADSDVRITDIAGNLVYKTTSLGGQAVWPVTDLGGKRVATGVYLVLATDPTGDYSCNTRVLVVR